MSKPFKNPSFAPSPGSQHTTPRLLLRQWAVDTPHGRRVWTYDLKTEKLQPKSIKSIMCSIGFYDMENGSSLDPFLTRIENQAGPILSKIRRARSPCSLSPAEQKTLALFVMLQYLRSPLIRNHLEDFYADTARDGNGTPIPKSKELFSKYYPEMMPVEVQSSFLANWSFDLARQLFQKRWAVVQARNASFLISDHPVVSWSPEGTGPGKATLKARTYYMPIAPHLLLQFANLTRLPFPHGAACGGIRGQMWARNGYMARDDVIKVNHFQKMKAVRWIVGASRSALDFANSLPPEKR